MEERKNKKVLLTAPININQLFLSNAPLITNGNDRNFEFTFEKIMNDNFNEQKNANEESEQLCSFYLKGTCKKGDKCSFKHTRGDKSVVCKHWLRGLCKKGLQCEFLHEYDLEKMPECHFFAASECTNIDCEFRHVNPDDKIKDCCWYNRGFCKYGPKCKNRHVTKLPCENYLEGFCPLGPNCRYGHPKFELPAMDNRNRAVGGKLRPTLICHQCNQEGHKSKKINFSNNEMIKLGKKKPFFKTLLNVQNKDKQHLNFETMQFFPTKFFTKKKILFPTKQFHLKNHFF